MRRRRNKIGIMKHFRYFLFLTAAISSVCSCVDDAEKKGGSNPVALEFEARPEESPIDLSLDKVTGIDIFDSRCVANEFKLKKTLDGSGFRVGGNALREDGYVAVHPSDAQNLLVGKKVTLRLGHEQNAVENSIDPANYKAVAEFLRSDGIIPLTPVVSYIALKGDFQGATISSLRLSSDQMMDGKAEVTLKSGQEPALRFVSGYNSVRLKADGSAIESSKSYIIAVWPRNYTNVKLTAENDKGQVQTIDIGSLKTERNKLTVLQEFTLDSSFWEDGGPYKVAEGTVSWSDGTPVEGVSVSDGFHVAVTDSKGHYRVNTSSDTYYIYFSYPENAKITCSNGCPQFFTRYDNTVREYNFTIEKQAVENEFALFAMADPQAHYNARSPQKVADTYRFDTESVPAINKQIAIQKVPCYGVTLGDIVYSEGSRNSNPGLKTMRTSFGKVNMPVFQTFGNHDFTYFGSSTELKTDEHSSTLNLKAQRQFEDTFGPVNYSFNRGNIHIVVMKNVQYDNPKDASKYHCGYSDEQWAWLQADLANVPKTKSVIICGHIPLATANSGNHVGDVVNLIKGYPGSTIFSGHTHYYRGYPNALGSGMYEHIHSAVCGQWWWSKIEGDGCPNGYTVYQFKDKEIQDAYFIGVNEGMNSRDYQMRIYRGNITNGGSHAYFKWMHGSNTLLINVFSGDSRWKVEVKENGVLKGTATLMSNSKKTYSSVSAGSTYEIPVASNQDWWAIGYHIGAVGRGTSSTSYYTNMFHMWKYTMSDPNASIEVIATDPYGNKYSCSEVIDSDCSYPSYIKIL